MILLLQIEGKFIIEEGIEDVHSQIEFQLIKKLGDIGKKFSARSRNDRWILSFFSKKRRFLKIFFSRTLQN